METNLDKLSMSSIKLCKWLPIRVTLVTEKEKAKQPDASCTM